MTIQKEANPLNNTAPVSYLNDETYYAEDGADIQEILDLLEDDLDTAIKIEEKDEELEPELQLEEFDYEDELPDNPEQVLELSDDDLENDLDDGNAAIEINDDLFDELMDGILPGANVAVVQEEEDEEPARETTWEDDGDHGKFIEYALNYLRSIPQHSGQTTVGCEKAISYLKRLNKEISRAVQTDEKNQIDESQIEKIRDKTFEWIEMLEDAYDQLVSKKRKRKKKASFSVGKEVVARLADKGREVQYFVSIAHTDGEEMLFPVSVVEPTDEQTRAFIAGNDKGLTKEAAALVTYVDPFLQSITRLLIRAHITQGKNLEDVYNQLNDQYEFTKREQLSIHEILLQKGLPLRADLGRLQEKDVSPFDSKNVEFSTEFYA